MTDFPLTITAWAAVILGALYIWQTFVVIGHRRSGKIVHGDGGDRLMAKKIRGHANAAEQIPLGLILIALNEMLHPGWVPVLLAWLLVAGRVSHALYFSRSGLPHQLRTGGMMMTMLAQIGGVVALAIGLLAG